jgi:hypothetical protein
MKTNTNKSQSTHVDCQKKEIKMKKSDYYFVAVLLTLVLTASTAFAFVGDVSALGAGHVTII